MNLSDVIICSDFDGTISGMPTDGAPFVKTPLAPICQNFALMLAFRPEECIDYVVLHEIAHLKYRRHDRNFYGFIARFMPDYKARVKALNMS